MSAHIKESKKEKSANTFTWNSRNTLDSINAGAKSYTYDALGRRVANPAGATTTNYLYDGANLVQEIQGTTVTANLLSSRIDEVFTRTDANGASNFLTDALGSPIGLTDPNRAFLAAYTYERFGNTLITGTSTNPYQYTGRENDGTGDLRPEN